MFVLMKHALILPRTSPHFEKMLYDQGQLLSAYADAYLISKDPVFENTARDIISYVTRDLEHPHGGFYSAEDADSFPTADAKEKLGRYSVCGWFDDRRKRSCLSTIHRGSFRRVDAR